MNKKHYELYTDFLIANFGQASATNLSQMVEGDVSHDSVTRFLSDREFTSRDLWREVKPVIRKIEKDDGVLIFDDTVQEKAWTDENEVVCWHYDHCIGRSVKGINLLNAVYHCSEISIPVAFEVVRKPLMFSDLETRSNTPGNYTKANALKISEAV
jgi:DDE superfamily endonuclease